MQVESTRSRGGGPAAGAVVPVSVALAAGETASGEFRCAGCGYGISVRTVLPACPMCRGTDWEEPSTGLYGEPRL